MLLGIVPLWHEASRHPCQQGWTAPATPAGLAQAKATIDGPLHEEYWQIQKVCPALPVRTIRMQVVAQGVWGMIHLEACLTMV